MKKEDSLPSKMESHESIILQMNKERLRLERQLSLLMKASFLQMVSCHSDFCKPWFTRLSSKLSYVNFQPDFL